MEAQERHQRALVCSQLFFNPPIIQTRVDRKLREETNTQKNWGEAGTEYVQVIAYQLN